MNPDTDIFTVYKSYNKWNLYHKNYLGEINREEEHYSHHHPYSKMNHKQATNEV